MACETDVSENMHTVGLSPASHPGILLSYTEGFGVECVFLLHPRLSPLGK